MTTSIESLVCWGTPEHGIKTARGIRSLRKADPTPAFWAEWRRNKAELQAQGITCKPDGPSWVVMQWLSPDDATALKPVATIESPCEIVSEAVAAAFKPNPPVDPKLGGIPWTEEQVVILNWFAGQLGLGNVAIDAVAGGGKTSTVTYGISVAPEQDIAYLVFNKKNQREAERKISDERVTVTTFNACGARIVSKIWRGVQWDDKVESYRVERVCHEIHSDALSAVLQLVAFAKNTFVTMPTTVQLVELADRRDIYCSVKDQDGGEEYPVEKIASIALLALKAATVRDPSGLASFNDQVWLSVVMGWVRPEYDLVVVDETQDMNAPQLAMIQKLVRKGGRTCIVGDPFQAIYGFRGAVQDGMGIMIRALSAKTLPMTISQRCSKAVAREAVAFVPHFKASESAHEGSVTYTDEAFMMESVAVGDAILSRANAPLMSACLQLLKKGVPARIEGRDIGQQLVGMVRKLKAKSVPDFLKKLSRWEDKQLSRFKSMKDADAKVAAIRDQRETLEAVAEGCASVAEIEIRISSLFQNSDDSPKPAVVLSSVHKAKGLEWDRVFMMDWTFGKRKPKTHSEQQEELNIKYVAITRAKKFLFRVAKGGQPKANTVEVQPDGTKAGAI